MATGDKKYFTTLDNIYPIGSIYISIDGTTPNVGTWEQLATGKCLWNTSAGGGSNLAGSLPNIAGGFTMIPVTDGGNSFLNTYGAFTGPGSGAAIGYGINWGSSSVAWKTAGFDASRSNGAYSAAAGTNVVRPDSIAVTMFKRIA